MAIIPFETKIDFMNPRWNRDAWSRIQADMDSSKESFGHASGIILGVKPGEKLRPLLGFQTFLATRLVPLPDGNIRRLNKEVIFYTNLTRLGQPGEIIEEWDNPWTKEKVKVVQVFNDPFNYTISDMLILAPEDFPGDRSKLPKIPLIFPWQELNGDNLVLSTDMHLNYPNPLQPDKWPRESAGPNAQVSEMMRYFVSRKDLENPKLTSVPYVGTWHRITPWLPWMLMGQTPGHCMYTSTMTGFDNVERLPKVILDYARKHKPDILSAPTEDYGPSHSSLEHYSKQLKPLLHSLHMRVLIVYAHPEPTSFNGAMKDLAVDTLSAAGHSVTVSDLYAQGFNPVAGAHDFTRRVDPARLDLGVEQANAARTAGFAPDVQAEIDKLMAADLLILQFPFWWYSVPAILKGWIDRVFAYGVAYDFGRTWDRGVFRGRRAMLAFTTSAPPTSSLPDGRNGDLERTLWPLHAGVLALCGFDVLQPCVAHAVRWVDPAHRETILADYRQRLLHIETDQPLFFQKLEDYGPDGRLKPDFEPATPGQHRGPRLHLD